MTPEQPKTLRVALEVIDLLNQQGIRYHLGILDLLQRTRGEESGT